MRTPLYVHIPYCLKKCGYCDFFSKPSDSVPSEYVSAVSRQVEYLAREFCVEEWKSVYIGGGSPSLLSAKNLELLCESIKAAATISANCEWTIEMNPGSISRELLGAADACGINRLSVGIQCKNQKVLDAIGRSATVAQIKEAAELLKKIWPHEWSADLIAGLPFQTKEDIARDIDFIDRNGANHISLYSLTLEEGTPLAKKIESGQIPYDEEAAEELWLYGRDLLEGRGFMQYEVSNFARPGFESKHNSAYWAQESYLGAGAGAAGTIYALPEGWRYTNVLDAAEYIKFWSEEGGANQEASQNQNVRAALGFPCQLEALDQDTQEFEYLMMNLRTRRGASAAEYKARYSKDLAARLGFARDKNCLQAQDAGRKPKGFTDQKGAAAWLERTERDGDAFYAMTREGLLFLNKFLEEL
ncbi:MAG: radical SAM family heme chaperone HemW [Treponema sp.]|nr:radical SAM family heme chaperone HemW [Treponema sp.]